MQREEILSYKGNFPINDYVYYQMDKKSREEITIDIHNFSAKVSREVIKGILEGFKILADRLRENDELQDVKIIKARSWIIEEYPGLIQRYGFSKTGVDSAKISKEDFVHRFKSQ